MWSRRRRRQALADRHARRPDTGGATLSPAALGHAPAAPRVRRTAGWRQGLGLSRLKRHPSRVAGAATAAVAALLGLHLAWSDRWVVHGAVVRGNQRVPAETIYAVSGLDAGRVFAVDLAAAVRRIETLEDVRRAEVGVAMPDRAWIRVEETAAVLRWDIPGARLGIDENGRAIPLDGVDASLVHVRDESSRIRAPGDRLPPALIAAAQAFGGRFGPLGYRSDAGFVIQTAEGWPVWLGVDAGSLDQQAATLDALRQKLAGSGQTVEVVDLRFPRGPYYRLKEATP
ncbi:hypothetical protein DCC79_03945 [bacterium]|nr:MAG: hypothetical protein DCC79_03945 [bacterium]